MTQDQLLAALSAHEDNFVERKPQGVNDREIRNTLVAFANSISDDRKAILFIGVKDDGSIEGCENTDALQKKIRRQCEEVCYPPIAFECEVLQKDGKNIVAVLVRQSAKRPHFSGPAFIRRGSASVKASEEVYKDLISSHNSLAAVLINMKEQVISVRTVACKLGEVGLKYANHYSQGYECMVLSCDPHTIRFRDISSQRIYSESLQHITVSFDEEKHRPLLTVSRY